MKRIFPVVTFTAAMFSTGMAFAAERTVTLSVDNMFCNACPIMVKKSLMSVEGVKNAEVSFEEKRAVVTFDDAKATIDALEDATFEAGYPSELVKP